MLTVSIFVVLSDGDKYMACDELSCGFSDPSRRLRVLQAGQLVVEEFTCSTYEEGDLLLRAGLTESADLVAVTLAPASADFTVSFAFQRTDASRAIVRQVPASSYVKKGRVMKDGEVSVYQGWMVDSQCDVLLTSYGPMTSMEKANSILKQVLLQTKVAGSRNLRLLDVALRKAKTGFKLRLATENFASDLATVVQRRKATAQSFSEAELLTILADVATGLSQAKSKVRAR